MTELQLLTTADICGLIKINRTTLWRWRRDGKFPDPIDLHGDPRWRASTVTDWIDEL